MAEAAPTRALAIAALARVEAGAWSNIVLRDVLGHSHLEARDRAFLTELVRGTLRWQLALDHLLTDVVSRPQTALDPPVRQALRVGAFQLVIAGIAPHAAVSETVGALGDHPGRRLVNAALRSLSRSGPPWPDHRDLVALAFPTWLQQRLSAAPAVMAALQTPATTHVRIRCGRANEAAGLLAGSVPGRLVAEVRRLDKGDPTSLVRRGLATVQDESSAAVGLVAGPAREGAPIVDLCAAPGGKATHLAERAPSSMVVAGDVHRSRVSTIAGAARRLSLPNVHPIVHDARHPGLAPLPEGSAILLDAPCSGLGTLRRRPEIKLRVDEARVAGLAGLQRELARAAVALVPRGGSLVYSACTLTHEETLDVASVLLDELEEVPLPLPLAGLPGGGEGPGGFLLPDVHDTDGMYVLGLRRP